MGRTRSIAMAMGLAIALVGCGEATENASAESPSTPDETTQEEVAPEPEPEPENTVEAEAKGSRWTSDDVEFQLTAIDLGTRDIDDSDVAPYASALDEAAPLCNEDRQLVGDQAVRAMQLAEEQGTPSSIMDMLRGLREAIPPEMAPMDCADIYASILVLMQG